MIIRVEKIVFKDFSSEIKSIEGERAFEVVITTTGKDRDGDIVEAKGAVLKNYRKNPVVLPAHKYSELSIARAENLRMEDDKIRAKVVFPPEGDYPLADLYYRMYDGKFQRGWSIGFIPLKWENIEEKEAKEGERFTRGRLIKKWEMLELSACAVGSNPDALNLMMNKGIDLKPLEEAGIIEIVEGKEGKETTVILVDPDDDPDEIEETPEEELIDAINDDGSEEEEKELKEEELEEKELEKIEENLKAEIVNDKTIELLEDIKELLLKMSTKTIKSEVVKEENIGEVAIEIVDKDVGDGEVPSEEKGQDEAENKDVDKIEIEEGLIEKVIDKKLDYVLGRYIPKKKGAGE